MQIIFGNVSQNLFASSREKTQVEKNLSRQNPIRMILLNPLNVKPVFGNTSQKSLKLENFNGSISPSEKKLF